ncbi:ATP-dependent DNA helicase RecG [Clostridium magnum]|uniref:ATP-dependent DNA helicase RecG n=1 Tax=Clostridium magnum DSM 2767 TaxID=1121326 RepID=A0A162UZY3_9CLOT|nr:ATP-dependent DNA helicase RecG [Clostridium magnum]KZL94442.1 ATP-dependent DNA helicase RecG [Clostridium magnum DSM 2767]SHI22171.1 ATP-dependent DNA helicase RecG [Clostridium magnum DSM 2767]
MNVYSSISSIKGVGPKTAEALEKCCIFNILDLLLYFPRDYEMISASDALPSRNNFGKVIINCKVVKIEKDIKTKTGKVLSTIIFDDGNNEFKGKWFNQPYIKNYFKINKEYTIMGKLQDFRGEVCLTNPALVKNNEKVITEEKIIPKYPLKSGVTNNLIIKLINQVLQEVTIDENLPDLIIDRYKLASLDKAIRVIHKPESTEDLHEATKRLKFQELFTYSLKILMLKDYFNKNKNGIAFKAAEELKLLKERLPYNLTNAQSRVIREILIDEKKECPMNRLVQGDVGSGKTIVALIAIFNVIKNGYQGVLMAPTEILATQHYIEAEKLLMGFGINIKLLCGSTTQKNKEKIKKALKDGEINLIIGTHALIEEDVEFENLGIVVTDEQHRFGVMQRSKLTNKGKNVDTLVMTATPIPRTLSLYLYGDLDVSIIDELPPGRQKIETYYINKSGKDRAYNFALEELKKGRQVYVVCPLVEESEELNLSSVEKLYEELKHKYFEDVSVEILHGKMTPKNKDEIMNRFKRGETKVIISTTVIEVGINVPNATLMIIENSERFGLAQLHQLRGRVGRGKHKSYCILIAEIKNDIIRRRMEIMKSSNDGFFIAEQDLKIRGAGEIFGFRQSGETSLILSDVVQDIELFKAANMEAKRLIESNDEKDIKIKNEILKKIEQSTRFICFN